MTKVLGFKTKKHTMPTPRRVPKYRQIVLGTSFFATAIPEWDHSISYIFSDIDDPDQEGACWNASCHYTSL